MAISYTSKFDPASYRRHAGALRRASWIRIALGGILAGILGFCVFLFCYGVWWVMSISVGQGIGLLLTFVFAILCGVLTIWQYLVNNVNDEIKQVGRDQVSTCRIDEDGFEVTRQNGLRVFIPWSIIALEHETKEAFNIRYAGNLRLAVFRAPLQEAGAEEEFRSKLQKKA